MDEEYFYVAIDDATHDVIAAFEDDFELPEGDALSDLMVQINDALATIMREAIERAEQAN